MQSYQNGWDIFCCLRACSTPFYTRGISISSLEVKFCQTESTSVWLEVEIQVSAFSPDLNTILRREQETNNALLEIFMPLFLCFKC